MFFKKGVQKRVQTSTSPLYQNLVYSRTSRLLCAISTIFSFISVFVSVVTVLVVLPKLHKNVHAKVA